MGAITFMLEDAPSSWEELESSAKLVSLQITTTGFVRLKEVSFLRELWYLGYFRQQARFADN